MKTLGALWRRLYWFIRGSKVVTNRMLEQDIAYHQQEGFVVCMLKCARCHTPHLASIEPIGDKLEKMTGYECSKCHHMSAVVMGEIDLDYC